MGELERVTLNVLQIKQVFPGIMNWGNDEI